MKGPDVGPFDLASLPKPSPTYLPFKILIAVAVLNKHFASSISH